MYRKTVSHPIYGTFEVEEESFLDFHRTLSGLSRLEDAAEEFASHGVGVEDMEPGFIKVKDDGREIVYWKILDQHSGKEMTLGVTQDEDRFPLYPREDGYWEPEGSGGRPDSSRSGSSRSGSKTSRRAPPAGENGSSEGSPKNGQSSKAGASGDLHERLAIPPRRSEEAETIQKIKNAREQWATNVLDEDHQKAIWRHVQRIRADDPKAALEKGLSKIESEDLTITYAAAETLLKIVENPSVIEGEGAGDQLDINDSLPY